MPAALTLWRNKIADEAGLVTAWVQVTLSGTYPTGGDVVDLTSLGIVGFRGDKPPIRAIATGQSGALYVWVRGTDSKTGKLKVFVEQTIGTNTLLGEHSNTTYVAGVSGDTIVLECVWPQFVEI